VSAIVNVTAFDAPPVHEPVTVTETVPEVATSAAGTVTMSCVEEEEVGVRVVLPNITTAPGTKFVPVTVKVKPLLPAAMQFGLSVLMVGFVPMLITSVAVPVLQAPAPLVALIVTLDVPAAVGVPEITPVLVFTVRPAGSPVALYVLLLSVLVAVIV
jgi:hypothetical protein